VISAWLSGRCVEYPVAMTVLDLPLRVRLRGEWRLSALEVERVVHSVDGTT
jgi:hypothetical protein